MFGKKKHKGLIWSVIISLIFSGCQSSVDTIKGIEISGKTQGTTYSIIIAENHSTVDKGQIDSLLANFDKSLSTYIDSSVISKINACQDSIRIEDKSGYFKECYAKSKHVYAKTNAAFDPSVFPLVKGWGFMTDMESPLNQHEIDSILSFVSFESGLLHSISFVGDEILFSKKHPFFMLDFNAIAQGQSVDVLANYLSKQGHENYFIEIGGEIYVRGLNRSGKPWKIGVDAPNEDQSRTLENILMLSNKGVATSGNYRKFYIKDGVKYAHTLNPQTGWPVQHSLLSATVVAENCALADAYATAFMVMGGDKAMEFVENNQGEELEIYLLSANDKGEVVRSMSSGFSKYISE